MRTRAASRSRDTPLAAYRKAFLTDPTSAFGGIIAFNRPVDAATAEAVAKQFVEVRDRAVVSTPEAMAVFAAKQNVRVLDDRRWRRALNALDMKRVGGGLLVQTADDAFDVAELRIVTKREPTPAEMNDLHVRLARGQVREVQRHRLLQRRHDARRGRGPDEPRRFRAHRRASRRRTPACRCAARWSASDAFFPFRDGLDVVAHAGARAVIQPGGSDARQGSDRRGRRARHRDGVHGHATLPPLEMQRRMKILVIGSGGREHALAWRLAQSPRSRASTWPPAMPARRARTACSTCDITGHQRARALREGRRHRMPPSSARKARSPRAWSMRSARRACASSGPRRRPRSSRLQGLRQGASCSATAFPPRLRDVHRRRRARTPTSTRSGAPIVIKADGLAAGKGVVVATTAAEAHDGDRHDARRQQARRRRAPRGDRGIPRGRGGELHRDVRRQERAAARLEQDHKRLVDGDRAPTPAAWARTRRRRW